MKADFGYSADTHSLLGAFFAPLASQGIETGGHFIPVGLLGAGFYIPEADYQLAQARANESGHVQFVGLAKDGQAIHASRESLHVDPNCDGYIAWIFPEVKA